jgi:dephospho-CoA kinase
MHDILLAEPQLKPRIIGIVGPIRAGKSTASTHLHEVHHYVIASNSEILKRICDGLLIAPNRDNLKRVGDAIFKVLGNETIARFRVAELGDTNIVVDGIRYLEEVNFYKKHADFRLLFLSAREELRFERAMALTQQGKDFEMGRHEFALMEAARSEAQIPTIARLADCALENNGTKAELTEKLDNFLQKWLSDRNASSGNP